MEFPNRYREERRKSKGESEVEAGSLLLMAFRFLKVPMPAEGDAEAVERAGQLLARWARQHFPWLERLLSKKEKAP